MKAEGKMDMSWDVVGDVGEELSEGGRWRCPGGGGGAG